MEPPARGSPYHVLQYLMTVGGQYWYRTSCCPKGMEAPHFGVYISNAPLNPSNCPQKKESDVLPKCDGSLHMLQIAEEPSQEGFFSSSFAACFSGEPNVQEKEWAYTSNKVIAKCLQLSGTAESALNGHKFMLVQFTDLDNCGCGAFKRSEIVMFPTTETDPTHTATIDDKTDITHRSAIIKEVRLPGLLFILKLNLEKLGPLGESGVFENVFALGKKNKTKLAFRRKANPTILLMQAKSDGLSRFWNSQIARRKTSRASFGLNIVKRETRRPKQSTRTKLGQNDIMRLIEVILPTELRAL